MAFQNFEFKACVNDLAAKEAILQQFDPIFIGEDDQTDTYFNVSSGRLKLREGNIENALIHYERADIADAKLSSILLYQHQPNAIIKEILIKTLGIKVVVQKRRKIYFIDNVKFHFDKVDRLGTFIEVEAIDKEGNIGMQQLKAQCSYYQERLGIKQENFLAQSYSDMLLEKSEIKFR